MTLERELEVALQAARLASDYIRREYETFVAIPDAHISISTEVDRQSQELILSHLHQAFPDDAMCAEENTPTYHTVPHRGRRVWVIDPIDGTRGFAMKNGEFSVMIGLLVDNRVVLGVVAEPAMNRVTYAALGSGCWSQTGDATIVRCSVTKTAQLAEATVIQSHYKPTTRNRPLELLQPAKTITTYSAGVKLAYVARGEADVYPNDYRLFHDWDICAGHFLVMEAGGKVTEFYGKSIEYSQVDFNQDGGLLASNGLLHEASLDRLKDVQLQ